MHALDITESHSPSRTTTTDSARTVRASNVGFVSRDMQCGCAHGGVHLKPPLITGQNCELVTTKKNVPGHNIRQETQAPEVIAPGRQF